MRADRLRTKISNLEFELHSAKVKMDKARQNKNYHKCIVIYSRKNLRELARENITVNINEFYKIKMELKHAELYFEQFKLQYDTYLKFLDKYTPICEAYKEEYNDIIKRLDDRKIILIFRGKDERRRDKEED
jgi:hypothetical protein